MTPVARPTMERRRCDCGCGKEWNAAVTSPNRYYSQAHDPNGPQPGAEPPKRRGRRPRGFERPAFDDQGDDAGASDFALD
jgi:hypothetical protein